MESRSIRMKKQVEFYGLSKNIAKYCVEKTATMASVWWNPVGEEKKGGKSKMNQHTLGRFVYNKVLEKYR